MKSIGVLIFVLLFSFLGYGQSPSFRTYMNPVIPGDHPDCSLTRIGNDFYSSGSSYNPTPVIYHSTDLVHWEAIAQPVSASWTGYGDTPGGGCVEGSLNYYNNKYWDFFSRGNGMYFVTADKPEGPWSLPTQMKTPSNVPGLGIDNSIFIDDSTWYLLVKNGQPNNWIVQLGKDGQPAGAVYNLTWINPAPNYPYSWAEGPVMWKYKDYYYYAFAINVGGGEKVMRSKTLTGDQASWEMLGDLFNENDPNKATSLFVDPNHSSQVVMLDDSTFWIAHPVYAKANEWKGQGRQGLLNQVHYNSDLRPIADYPDNQPFTAPNLPSSGIPWMVPHTDLFTSTKLNPEWSFLGYTPANSYSLTDRPGWLRLSPKSSLKANTVIKNDGEHNYSLITRLDFHPSSSNDEAGLRIIRGDETQFVKLASSLNADGKRIIFFSFDNTKYEADNSVGDTLWLKMIRVNHKISGYYSNNGDDWIQVGQNVDISSIDSYTDSHFSVWEGTRQGLYVQGSTEAFFDLYIYRDAYTPILAECPANHLGTTREVLSTDTTVLDNCYYGDWAMYAGVEFGNDEYQKNADSIKVVASSATYGGTVEVYIDSMNASTKIAECNISGTGSWTTFKTFAAKLTSQVSGHHDVYLLFTGSVTDKLFMLQSFYFTGSKTATGISGENLEGNNLPRTYNLKQNYPNPFNPATEIQYSIPKSGIVILKVFNLLGQEVATLVNQEQTPGSYKVSFDASKFASGVYLYRIQSGNYSLTKKMILMK